MIIGLNMIVKNEEKIIHRCLEFASVFIDTYVIIDTGSTDNTIKIIEEFFAANPPKYGGKIIKKPFINFAVTRTEALKECKNSLCDYILCIDADMVLQVNIAFVDNKQGFIDKYGLENKNKIYHIIQEAGNHLSYSNVRLIPNKVDDIEKGNIKYQCYTHEYLSFSSNYEVKTIDKEDLLIIDVGDGGSKDDKYIRDMYLLTKGLKDDPVGIKDRYTFYLANTYYNYGENCQTTNEHELAENYYNLALYYYQQRIKMGGYIQEIWYSLYRMGLIHKQKNNTVNSLNYWLKAFEIIPYRLENIYEIILYYRVEKMYKAALIYYNLANDILNNSPLLKDTKASMLFVHDDIYNYRLLYEYSIIAFYLNIRNINNELVYLLNVKDNEIVSNTLHNIQFYNIKLMPLKKITYKNIKYTANDDTFISSSSAMIKYGDKFIVNIRMVNYYIDEFGKYTLGKDNKIVSNNYMLIFDEKLHYNNSFKYNTCRDDVAKYKSNLYIGIEDIKLFNVPKLFAQFLCKRGQKCLENDILMTGTIWRNSVGKLGICMGLYVSMAMGGSGGGHKAKNNAYELIKNDEKIDFNIEEVVVPNGEETSVTINAQKNEINNKNDVFELNVPFNDVERVEKNWALVNYKDDLRIIYKWGDGGAVANMVICKISDTCTGTGTNLANDTANEIKTLNIEIVDKKIMPNIFSHVSGSSNGFYYKNEGTYWFVCHLVCHETPRIYYHMIVVLDGELNLLKYSAPFSFENEKIEYCLSINIIEGNVYMTYSTWDKTTNVGIYNLDYLKSLIKYSP